MTIKDVTGKPIRIGDVVRVIDVPDLSGMSAHCRAESLPVFQHLVGTYMSGSDLQSEMDRIPDGTQLELNRTF
jgi:hypothetical protein